MGLNDRLFYLILGILIGLAWDKLDRLVKKVDEMKEELDEVDEIVKQRNEGGYMHSRVIRDVIVGILLVATSFAAISAGIAKEHSDDALDRSETQGYCSQQLLGKLLISVNERGEQTKPLSQSNISLQTSFKNLMDVLVHIPPYSEARREKEIQSFRDDQNTYILKAHKQLSDVKKNPLPTIEEYKKCLHAGTHPEGEQDESK